MCDAGGLGCEIHHSVGLTHGGWLGGWLVCFCARGIRSISCFLDKVGCSLCWLVGMLSKQSGYISSLLLVCLVHCCLQVGLYSP